MEMRDDKVIIKMDSILQRLEEKGLSVSDSEAKKLGTSGVLERIKLAYKSEE
jgi:hypothetical protein